MIPRERPADDLGRLQTTWVAFAESSRLTATLKRIGKASVTPIAARWGKPRNSNWLTDIASHRLHSGKLQNRFSVLLIDKVQLALRRALVLAVGRARR